MLNALLIISATNSLKWSNVYCTQLCSSSRVNFKIYKLQFGPEAVTYRKDGRRGEWERVNIGRTTSVMLAGFGKVAGSFISLHGLFGTGVPFPLILTSAAL